LDKHNSTIFSASDPTDDLITINAVHGAFPYSAMPSWKIENIIAAHVPRNQIKDVADTYPHRWWDYRRMQPGHSFMLFAHTYYRYFRQAGRKVLSLRDRSGRRADLGVHQMSALVGVGEMQFSANEIWDRDQAHITGMWKAMLTCDALGLPYDVFCRTSFQHAIDTAWKRLPRPQQLYSEKFAAHVYDKWLALADDRVFLARHPIYKVENYVGTPLQDEYRSYAIRTLQGCKNVVPHLSEVVFRSPQIPEALAASHFPARAMQRAKLLAS